MFPNLWTIIQFFKFHLFSGIHLKMFSEHAEMMDLSSSDVSDSEVSIPTRGMSIYKSDWNVYSVLMDFYVGS